MRAASTVGGRGSVISGRHSGRTVSGLVILAISGGLFWLVWIYGHGLRDPRYLDGWLLAGGMCLQLGFHVAIKGASLSPKSASRFRSLHIFLGYLLIAAFISHSDFSLPDTGFEWALWTCFVLVTLSGVFGTYLAWSLQVKRGSDERTSDDRIATRCAELAQEVQAVVRNTEAPGVELGLPAPPYHAWIMDLYTDHLEDFFQGQGDVITQLAGSQRSLKRLTDEIDNLTRYVDKQGQEKLAAIKALLIEKDKLDFARVHSGLTKGWLLVHVPVTYALFVLSVSHILIVYAFSSGVW